MTARVLALDTSTRTGWAHCTSHFDQPAYGTLLLPGWHRDVVGQSYAKLFDFVVEKIVVADITHIIIERPLTVHAHAGDKAKNADLAAALLGFVAVAECAAVRAGKVCVIESPATIRKHFVGSGRPPDPKTAVMAQCSRLGWRVMDDNQADALATWDYAVHRFRAIERAAKFNDSPRRPTRH